MPPYKKVPKTEALAKEQGLSSMTSFFSAKKAPGRPAKKRRMLGARLTKKARPWLHIKITITSI